MHRHPLFLNSTLCFPNTSGAGIDGFYNPIIDGAFFAISTPGVEQHEIAHRLFSVGLGGFDLLRQLAGYSYVMLWALIETANRDHVRLLGTSLSTLRSREPSAAGRYIESIIQRLRQVQSLYDMFYRALVPVAEIAAIDFAPGKFDHKWFPYRISNSDPAASATKTKLVDSVASQFPPDFGGYSVEYGSFRKALRRVWNTYTAVENPDVARALLQMVMSSILLADNDTPPGQIDVADTLAMILEAAPKLRTAGKEELVTLAGYARIQRNRTRKLVRGWASWFLSDIPKEYHVIGMYPMLLEKLTWFSRPGNNPIPSAPARWLFEELNNPRNSLLVFSLKSDGLKECRLNAGHQHLLTTGLLPELPLSPIDHDPDSTFWWPQSDNPLDEKDFLEELAHCETFGGHPDKISVEHFTETLEEDGRVFVEVPGHEKIEPLKRTAKPVANGNWWHSLALFESLRQALAQGESIDCPFSGWTGIDCAKGCFSRPVLRWLGQNTELSVVIPPCDQHPSRES